MDISAGDWALCVKDHPITGHPLDKVRTGHLTRVLAIGASADGEALFVGEVFGSRYWLSQDNFVLAKHPALGRLEINEIPERGVPALSYFP